MFRWLLEISNLYNCILIILAATILIVDYDSKCSFRMHDHLNPLLANLRDWPVGPMRVVESQSLVIQWLLDANWFNWSREDRDAITRDIEANRFIRVTPTRLGARLQFLSNDNGRKIFASIFIQLFDERVMKGYLFRIRTYKVWFRKFLRELKRH